jgi:hypothetical protein
MLDAKWLAIAAHSWNPINALAKYSGTLMMIEVSSPSYFCRSSIFKKLI